MRITIQKILLLFVLQLAGVGLSAQTLTTQDPVLSPNQLLEQDLAGPGNTTHIDQIGSDNNVEIVQRQQGLSRINLVKALQTGDMNEAYFNQQGSGNQTVLVQRGAENFYQLNLDGIDNEMVIIQDGDRNRVIQNLTQSNELNIELIQRGNDNEIIQILDEANTMEFKLIQNGNGMKAIINQTPQ